MDTPTGRNPAGVTEHTVNGSDVAFRVVRAVLIAAIVLTPLLLTIRVSGQSWFAWHMYSRVNADVVYEIADDGSWSEVELTELSRWNRGAHVGDVNLRALCEGDPGATAARRLVADRVDEEISCR